MVAAHPHSEATEPDQVDLLHPAGEADDQAFPASSGVWRVPDLVVLAGVVLAGVVLRFVTRSPAWLDEALTVNIAKLPLGQIPGALRHDGHPPLYYFMLHGWMVLFGSSNLAVRSLAGLFGVATLPLTWLVARRVAGRAAAWCAVAVLSLMPYALRYSTENRMYAMVMVLVLVGWLLVDDALRSPTTARLLAIAIVTGALLWTHYWALWIGAAAALCLMWRWRRLRGEQNAESAKATAKVLAALAVGFVLFLPWIPALLYQAKHTGTPWARRSWPTTMAAVSVQDLGGGGKADAQLLGWFVVIAAFLGVLALALDHRRILLDVRGRPAPRRLAVLILVTLAIASVVGIVTNSAFQSRYNAVWVPFLVVLAGCGLAQFRGPALRRALLAVVLGVSLPGAARNVLTPRTQAREIATAIRARAHPGDLVVTCPDQLGPSLIRELGSSSRVSVVGYPGFTEPLRIDWVDYVKRLGRITPEDYARQVLARSAGRQLFVVWDGTYLTHTGLCERFNHELTVNRGASETAVVDSSTDYEHAWLVVYPPAAAAR